MFESYRDRFRLAYLYVREAHPDPNFAPCGPTSELGWEHPSADTRSLAERAQRARWLQDDLDLGYPYLVDRMDGRIQQDLLPFGFYAGWVVDCSGEVRAFEPWGWATPDTQWCGLPLADVADLVALLDASDPAAGPCFPPAEPTRDWLVPGAARLLGIDQIRWSTDLVLANPGPSPLEVTLELLMDATAKRSTVRSLPPRGTLVLDDVIGATFGTSGAGAIRVRAPRDVVVAARTSASTPAGLLRQHIAAIRTDDAAHDLAPAHLLPVEQSDDRRTDLQLVNLTGSPTWTRVVAAGPDGTILAQRTLLLAPHEVHAMTRALERLGAGAEAAVRIEVHALSPGARVLASASIVHEATADAVAVAPRLVTFATDHVVAAGAGPDRDADVVVHNPLETPVRVTLEARPLDSGVPATSVVRTVAPGATLEVASAIGAQAGDVGPATLLVRSDDGVLAGSAGRLGDGRPLAGPALDLTGEQVLRPGGVGHLVGLDRIADAGRSTAVVVQELEGRRLEVEVRLVAGDGAVRSTTRHVGPPGRALRLDDALGASFPDGVTHARAELRLVGPSARAAAWAETRDGAGGDAVVQVAVVLAEGDGDEPVLATAAPQVAVDPTAAPHGR